MEKVLDYSRATVAQETGFWCGPATLQNILDNRGVRRSESSLAQRMGTTTNGTNHIGLLCDVLNQELRGADYAVVQMPSDPPSVGQRETLWQNVVRSIDAGYGVAVNIVAPPSNYPRAVAPSTISPAYGGGTVYHYVAVMGYSDVGQRRYWVADSGFTPYGYWISHAQLATLIPPKGYAYATGGRATPAPPPSPQGMTADALAEAWGRRSGVDYAALAPGCSDAMRLCGATTVNRAAMFLAQLGHESGGGLYREELASGEAYNGRADLGNTEPGDGPRFKGRSFVQITGRGHYRNLSEWAFTKRLVTSPTFFVDNPPALASSRYVWLGAVWYFTVSRPTFMSTADRGDLEGCTRLVNGGLNGLADRRIYWDRARAMGERILPSTTGGLTMDASTELTKRFPSRSIYRHSDALVDTMAGFVLNIDARIHEQWVREQAEAGDTACIDLVKREAAKGDAASKACLARIEGASK